MVTIFLGVSVGASMTAETFLKWETIAILLLGFIAFSIGTATGVIFGKIMAAYSRTPINPLIGAAGVSAVPMAARVVQKVGPTRIRVISCSCTRWAPTWPASSARRLRPAF